MLILTLFKKIMALKIIKIFIINHFSGFIAGKHKTSYILMLSVNSIVSLSIPNPHPAVGGNPYSKLFTKFSSIS